MKFINLFAFIFVGIFLLSIVSAEVNQTNKIYYGILEDDGSVTETQTSINNFNVLGFVCTDNNCNSVNGTLWSGNPLSSGSSSQITLTYPTKLQQSGYGVYYYKTGYIPYEVKSTLAGTGNADSMNIFLAKSRNCEVPINHLILSHNGNNITVNVTLDASVTSPISHAGPLNYVPSALQSSYSVDSKVDFRLVGPDNVTITKQINLPYSETREVSASWKNLGAGYYDIQVEANTVDDKCLHSVPNLLSSNVTIVDNRTNATLPLIGILSPENRTYNNKTILVNLRAINATQVLFNWNGTNMSYTSPLYVTFNEGSNTLRAYAINNVTTASVSVTFNVNTSSNNTNNSDTTPPGPVTGLHAQNIGQNFIYWIWNNPMDSDFSHNIIYIDGVNVINSSNNFYNLTGLASSSTHTIRVETVDYSGNINHNAVTDTVTTLSGGNNNNGGGHSSNSTRAKLLGPYIAPENNITHYEEDSEPIDLTIKKESRSSLYWILLILLLLVSILLLLIIILLSRKK